MEVSDSLSKIYSGVKKDSVKRRENDLYETPPIATYLLHKYSNIPDKIIEPCAGRGNIAVELQRCGYDVKAFDLNEYSNYHVDVITGQDVLFLDKIPEYDTFITNPPYYKDLPRKIAEKAISEYMYTALFVRITFLEGTKRKKLFDRYPPSDIIIFSDRVKFEKNLKHEPIALDEQLGGMISYMWIIWDKRKDNQSIKWVCIKDEYEEWKSHYENTTSLSIVQ
jgi:hypothetical protein